MKNKSKSKNGLITVAEYLVSLFPKTGVELIPLFQGGNIMKFIDEVGKHPKLKYIVPNHEQALAIIVDGYARLNGFGIGMATSGPGVTNLMTGIACAYFDSIPCLFLTGQVGRFHIKGERGVRQRGFQETDVMTMVKPITKFAVTLMNPEEARFIFEKAVYLARSGRPGPVVIDIPYDVQRALVHPAKLKKFIPPAEKKTPQNYLVKSVSLILKEIKKAQRPVLLLGGGVRLSGQVPTVRAIAAGLNIPVVSTWSAMDIFKYDYPLYGGNIGINGHHSAHLAVQASDLLISFGNRFTTKGIINEKEFAKNARVIAADIDRAELTDGLIPVDQKIHADLREFLPLLLAVIRKSRTKFVSAGWLKEFGRLKSEHHFTDVTVRDHPKYLSPYKFIPALSEVLKKDDIIVTDTGINLIWMTQAFRIKQGQRFFSAFGHSPMGYAMTAAIGAYYANKNRKANIVAAIGDGGMQMNIQELQTIAHNKVPVKVFIFNNRCLGNLKFPVRANFEGRTHAIDAVSGYSPPDFVKVARAYGLKAIAIPPAGDFKKQIKEALDFKGPVIVDVPIDPEQYIFENKFPPSAPPPQPSL